MTTADLLYFGNAGQVMVGNLKLRDRALLGYALPTGMIILFSGMVHLVSGQISEILKHNERTQTVLLDAKKLGLHMANMERRVKRHLLLPSQEAIDLLNQDFTEIQQSRSALLEEVKDAKQKDRIQRLYGLAEELHQSGMSVVRRSERRLNDAATASYIQTSLSLTHEFERLNREFIEEGRAALKNDVSRTQDLVQLLSSVSLIIAVISAIVSSVAAYMVSRSLNGRIQSVITIADGISNGDFSQSLAEDSARRDEIGQLMGAFEKMSFTLNALLTQVQQASLQVSTSCLQIGRSGMQLDDAITEQVSSTSHVATSAQEIAATSAQLVRTMENVAGMSQTTAQMATHNQTDLIQMESTMRRLADSTQSISTKLGAISEKANNINSIVATITKVADQTNLLSLNAAIEAEKAGEYGLGFSVVAKEIRRLADQTAIATIDIEQMVKEMQSAVSMGVMEMDKFSQEVSQGVQNVGGIIGQLGTVIEQVQNLTPRFDAVNQGMELQAEAAKQISTAMLQLNQTSHHTSDSLSKIKLAITELSQAEQDLQREISRFKIRGVATTLPLSSVPSVAPPSSLGAVLR